MSCYFQIGDEILWNPSNRVAKAFLLQSRAVSDFIGTPAGIGPVVDDECQIDFGAYENFVDELVAVYSETCHGVLRALLQGFIATAMVLYKRAGGSIECENSDLLAMGEAQEKWMPR